MEVQLKFEHTEIPNIWNSLTPENKYKYLRLVNTHELDIDIQFTLGFIKDELRKIDISKLIFSDLFESSAYFYDIAFCIISHYSISDIMNQFDNHYSYGALSTIQLRAILDYIGNDNFNTLFNPYIDDIRSEPGLMEKWAALNDTYYVQNIYFPLKYSREFIDEDVRQLFSAFFDLGEVQNNYFESVKIHHTFDANLFDELMSKAEQLWLDKINSKLPLINNYHVGYAIMNGLKISNIILDTVYTDGIVYISITSPYRFDKHTIYNMAKYETKISVNVLELSTQYLYRRFDDIKLNYKQWLKYPTY